MRGDTVWDSDVMAIIFYLREPDNTQVSTRTREIIVNEKYYEENERGVAIDAVRRGGGRGVVSVRVVSGTGPWGSGVPGGETASAKTSPKAWCA